jgi:hypothetical protein
MFDNNWTNDHLNPEVVGSDTLKFFGRNTYEAVKTIS